MHLLCRFRTIHSILGRGVTMSSVLPLRLYVLPRLDYTVFSHLRGHRWEIGHLNLQAPVQRTPIKGKGVPGSAYGEEFETD